MLHFYFIYYFFYKSASYLVSFQETMHAQSVLNAHFKKLFAVDWGIAPVQDQTKRVNKRAWMPVWAQFGNAENRKLKAL